MACSSSRVIVPPVGLVGKFRTNTLLRSVIAASMAGAVTLNFSSARQATGTATPWASAMEGE